MTSAKSEKSSWAFNGVPESIGVDAAALASELKSRTSGEVLFLCRIQGYLRHRQLQLQAGPDRLSAAQDGG